jgi:hypothetical protein
MKLLSKIYIISLLFPTISIFCMESEQEDYLQQCIQKHLKCNTDIARSYNEKVCRYVKTIWEKQPFNTMNHIEKKFE